MPARRLRRHAGEHDLFEALAQPGCPVCRLGSEAVDAYLASVCYEQVNDLDLRKQLRGIGGFCPPHAHRFLRQRHGALASAIVYRDVLAAAARRIEQKVPNNGSLLAGLLGGKSQRRAAVGLDARRCPACVTLADSERRHLDTLRSRVLEPRMQEAYTTADGLCLPHLDRLLEIDDDGSRFLAQSTVNSISNLVGELDRYIQKHDYRFRTELWDEDAGTPTRAVERAAGRPERYR